MNQQASVQSSETTKEIKNKPLRFVTAGALFDGHDAAINVMRRVLQSLGAEVIHLGHNRSAEEIVDAAVQEDAHGIGISSYQGGHNEFFPYVIDLLKQKGASHIKVFGGGGGVIIPKEIKELHKKGVTRIYSPEDGRLLGLQGMIQDMMMQSDFSLEEKAKAFESNLLKGLKEQDPKSVARIITLIERKAIDKKTMDLLHEEAKKKGPPVLGITGTGGAGKSSLTDELILRWKRDFPDKKIAVLAVDPTKRKTGGALLGDRIRMNAATGPQVFMRSLATRGSGQELSKATGDALLSLKAAGYDWIILETSGIGQGDAEISAHADLSLYVMTSEFGASTQLEKIDMLDFANFVAINKFERKGSKDALRDVQKQIKRNQGFSQVAPEIPVVGTIASQFNDPGMTQLYLRILNRFAENFDKDWKSSSFSEEDLKEINERGSLSIVPRERGHYLNEITNIVHQYKNFTQEESQRIERWETLEKAARYLEKSDSENSKKIFKELHHEAEEAKASVHYESFKDLEQFEAFREEYQKGKVTYKVRQKTIEANNKYETLSGLKLSKVALPRTSNKSELYRFLRSENLPGVFPFTAGVFPFKRENEDPKRMFAGEGPPDKTNKRFHYLCEGESAHRLSTAFDSVTLYGEDPHERPDIYGKIGESGVSIATLEDMKKLYAGFDLCAPTTSVSMTINGPAPTILAMFLNTAIDQQIENFKKEKGREPSEKEHAQIKRDTLKSVRGTVQADILKEDQAQNTCIFSIDFALKLMGDVQAYFIENEIRNFYSVSISGYHIAEAGANPITQLAFTLSNGFTYLEYYRSRGMDVNAFAPNFSYFFSNGLDAEYSVMGRVARRIWAIALRDLYGGNERSQKLKYHIQTSGRSLHAEEIDFNDIRTTLQALTAYYDHCNSLHTNAYDEAITTPSQESVRRAMAIQLIIGKEFGPAKSQNPIQGSYMVNELTDLVEEAVLAELVRLDERGGVLGAMESQYQRGKIQEESLHYETLKHSGELPVVGVNTFLNPSRKEDNSEGLTLARSSNEEKDLQIKNLRSFQEKNKNEAQVALEALKEAALRNENIFSQLMKCVRVASLGQITQALDEVGGKYRRNL
jgi:methylmalonyl-CoA mutase